jgi:hypothetical protein
MGLGGARAEAQWGMGYGGFWGVMNAGGGQSNMATLNYINQRTSQAAANAYATRGSIGGGNVYAGNPNSYINHVRDNSSGDFFERFDVSTRRGSGFQPTPTAVLAASMGPAPRTTGPIPPPPDIRGGNTAAPNPAANPPPRHVAPPLASFFTAAGMLLWPSEAPTAGELGAKRDSVDASAQAVRAQEKANGSASIGLVTEARSRLLAYGRPALAYIREHATPALADTFNNFLLGLYDSLGAAATP